MRGSLKHLPLVLYLALSAIAERTATSHHLLAGLLIYALILIGTLALSLTSPPLRFRFFVALATIPITRILSFTTSLQFEDRFVFLGITSAASILTAIAATRAANCNVRHILQIGRFLPLNLMVAFSGIAIAALGSMLIQPTGTFNKHDLLSIGLLLGAAFGEELLFRGLLQRAAIKLVGAPIGVSFSALAFGLMHVGGLPILGVVFMTLIGLYFGMTALYTRSLIGVVGANGIASILLFAFLPMSP